jgi:hypothetical protein
LRENGWLIDINYPVGFLGSDDEKSLLDLMLKIALEQP